jgi:hypothetical protein
VATSRTISEGKSHFSCRILSPKDRFESRVRKQFPDWAHESGGWRSLRGPVALPLTDDTRAASHQHRLPTHRLVQSSCPLSESLSGLQQGLRVRGSSAAPPHLETSSLMESQSSLLFAEKPTLLILCQILPAAVSPLLPHCIARIFSPHFSNEHDLQGWGGTSFSAEVWLRQSNRQEERGESRGKASILTPHYSTDDLHPSTFHLLPGFDFDKTTPSRFPFPHSSPALVLPWGWEQSLPKLVRPIFVFDALCAQRRDRSERKLQESLTSASLSLPHSGQVYVTDIMNPKIGSTILTRAGLLPPPLPGTVGSSSPNPFFESTEAPDDASTGSSSVDPQERDKASQSYSPIFTTNPHSLRRRLLSPPIGHEKSARASTLDEEECLIFRSFHPPSSPSLHQQQNHGSNWSAEPKDSRSRLVLREVCPLTLSGHYGNIRESEIPASSASEDIQSLILTVSLCLCLSAALALLTSLTTSQNVGLSAEGLADVLHKFTPTGSSLSGLRKLDLSGNRSRLHSPLSLLPSL